MNERAKPQGDTFKRQRLPFAMVPEALLYDTRLSVGARLLYAVLDRHADSDNGSCWPGVERLAYKLGVLVETARKFRRELEAHGWLVNNGQRLTGGQFRSNAYVLLERPEGAEKPLTVEPASVEPASVEPITNERRLNESPTNERRKTLPPTPRTKRKPGAKGKVGPADAGQDGSLSAEERREREWIERHLAAPDPDEEPSPAPVNGHAVAPAAVSVLQKPDVSREALLKKFPMPEGCASEAIWLKWAAGGEMEAYNVALIAERARIAQGLPAEQSGGPGEVNGGGEGSKPVSEPLKVSGRRVDARFEALARGWFGDRWKQRATKDELSAVGQTLAKLNPEIGAAEIEEVTREVKRLAEKSAAQKDGKTWGVRTVGTYFSTACQNIERDRKRRMAQL